MKDKPQLLLIQCDQFDQTGVTREPADCENVVDYPPRRGNAITQVTEQGNETWWVETRTTWCSAFTPDLVFPINIPIEPFERSQFKRYGEWIYCKGTEPKAKDRLLSLMNTDEDEITYTYSCITGEQVEAWIRKTNSRTQPAAISWHHALDNVIGHGIYGGTYALEITDRSISVRQDVSPNQGTAQGLDGL